MSQDCSASNVYLDVVVQLQQLVGIAALYAHLAVPRHVAGCGGKLLTGAGGVEDGFDGGHHLARIVLFIYL